MRQKPPTYLLLVVVRKGRNLGDCLFECLHHKRQYSRSLTVCASGQWPNSTWPYTKKHHRGHLMFVKPEERPFVTAELIRLTTITETEKEIEDRIAALFAAGYTEIAVQIVPGQEHALEDWGKIRRAFA